MNQSSKQTVSSSGWFPDPGGSGRLRWWDGDNWTDSFFDTPAWKPARHRLGRETPTYTPFLWTILALPAVMIILDLVLSLWVPGYRGGEGYETANPEPVMLADLFVVVIFLLSYALTVVMAYLDWRWLARVGVVRPFHWAWGFLPTVYVIGRTIVLRQVVPGSSLAPIWCAIALVALNWISSSW